MKFYALTDIGKRREINEDSYYLPVEGESFCVVADGMGGHNAGEVASATAVDAFAEAMRGHALTNEERIEEAVKKANRAVYTKAQGNSACRGMGTTMTALADGGDRIIIAHVGDSCCFRIRGGKIKKITHDHSYVQEMVEAGVMTPLEAENSPYRNYITRSVGTRSEVEVDTYIIAAKKDDAFLLCSDGLSNHVTQEEMAEITADEAMNWDEKLRKMIELALSDGGPDNITGVYAICTEDHR